MVPQTEPDGKRWSAREQLRIRLKVGKLEYQKVNRWQELGNNESCDAITPEDGTIALLWYWAKEIKVMCWS